MIDRRGDIYSSIIGIKLINRGGTEYACVEIEQVYWYVYLCSLFKSLGQWAWVLTRLWLVTVSEGMLCMQLFNGKIKVQWLFAYCSQCRRSVYPYRNSLA